MPTTEHNPISFGIGSPRFEIVGAQPMGAAQKVGEQELSFWYIGQIVGGPFVFTGRPGPLKFKATWCEYDKNKPLRAEAVVDFVSVRGKYLIEARRIGNVVRLSVHSEYEHAVVWESTVPIDQNWIYGGGSSKVTNGMTVSTTVGPNMPNQSTDPTP